MHSSPMNGEFVGMADYIMESFHDLLTADSESLSDPDSSRGNHHPSWECFMEEIPEGHIESIHEGGADLPCYHDDDDDKGVGAFLHVWEEHLRP